MAGGARGEGEEDEGAGKKEGNDERGNVFASRGGGKSARRFTLNNLTFLSTST